MLHPNSTEPMPNIYMYAIYLLATKLNSNTAHILPHIKNFPLQICANSLQKYSGFLLISAAVRIPQLKVEGCNNSPFISYYIYFAKLSPCCVNCINFVAFVSNSQVGQKQCAVTCNSLKVTHYFFFANLQRNITFKGINF